MFNGDPPPGNYRFHRDGSVTFLDFGLVKRWTAGEWGKLAPVLDAVLAHDPVGTVRRMVEGGVTILLTTQYLEEADQLASTIVEIPPRGRKSPTTFAHTGSQAFTTSSRFRASL